MSHELGVMGTVKWMFSKEQQYPKIESASLTENRWGKWMSNVSCSPRKHHQAAFKKRKEKKVAYSTTTELLKHSFLQWNKVQQTKMLSPSTHTSFVTTSTKYISYEVNSPLCTAYTSNQMHNIYHVYWKKNKTNHGGKGVMPWQTNLKWSESRNSKQQIRVSLETVNGFSVCGTSGVLY